EATKHPFGRLVRAAVDQGERWLGAAVGTDQLDLHSSRLGLSPITLSSVSSEGVRSTFRLLGDPLSNAPAFPFFIEWGRRTEPWPPKGAALNPRYRGVEAVEAAADAGAVATHLGGAFPFYRVSEGTPRIRAVVLDTEDGDVTLE